MLPPRTHGQKLSRTMYRIIYRTECKRYWEARSKMMENWLRSFPIAIFVTTPYHCRSQWPRGLRPWSTAARPLRLCVQIPPGGMDVWLLWVLCIVR